MAKSYLSIPELSESEVTRFWQLVAPPNENGCELWVGGPTIHPKRRASQYGALYIRGTGAHASSYRVTRIAYYLYHGVDPQELFVCHNCPGGDNPRCVAKAHLFLGTGTDNMQDASKKGRMTRGERQKAAKLTEAYVREIRRRRAQGAGLLELATDFHVTRALISMVCLRQIWTHVD